MLSPALRRWPRRAVAALTACWLVAVVVFVVWWVEPAHRFEWSGFAVNSVLLAIAVFLSAYFLTTINRMACVDASKAGFPELRVAMVVTKAPSEPWRVVRKTLRAMLEQDYPADYDVWLADEDPSERTARWCRERGVLISTRRGDARYQRQAWPRRRRCKEGNLAFFYDNYGYERYDVVSQLDSDHVPNPGYLRAIVDPFADSAVGYVAAPSVCDANADESWTVRGRPDDEAAFHGAQQIGMNRDGTPVCIGSHYAVRTDALREIGGLGPDLAEDFTTSYLLNVAGWRGAFAINAEAHGDGPPDFAAMVTQEFQWSRSLTTVFFGLVLRTCGALSLRLGMRFLFQAGIYMVLAVLSLGGLTLFAVACVLREPWVSVNFLVFVGLWFMIGVWLLGIVAVVRRQGLLRPVDAPIVSWERMLYAGSRIPFIIFGVIAGVASSIAPRATDFKITPKGKAGAGAFPVRLVAPFCVTALILTASAAVGLGSADVIGYVGLSLLTAVVQLVIAIAVTLLHAFDARRNGTIALSGALRLVRWPLLLGCLSVVPVVLVSVAYAGELSRGITAFLGVA